jgi:hypothetical protein
MTRLTDSGITRIESSKFVIKIAEVDGCVNHLEDEDECIKFSQKEKLEQRELSIGGSSNECFGREYLKYITKNISMKSIVWKAEMELKIFFECRRHGYNGLHS